MYREIAMLRIYIMPGGDRTDTAQFHGRRKMLYYWFSPRERDARDCIVLAHYTAPANNVNICTCDNITVNNGRNVYAYTWQHFHVHRDSIALTSSWFVVYIYTTILA